MDDGIWLAKNVLKALILPPTPFLLVGLAALLFAWRSRWARVAGIASLLVLWALSTGAVANALSGWLEADAPPLAPRDIGALKGSASAIVILGGGRRRGAVETPAGEALSSQALARCAYLWSAAVSVLGRSTKRSLQHLPSCPKVCARRSRISRAGSISRR